MDLTALDHAFHLFLEFCFVWEGWICKRTVRLRYKEVVSTALASILGSKNRCSCPLIRWWLPQGCLSCLHIFSSGKRIWEWNTGRDWESDSIINFLVYVEPLSYLTVLVEWFHKLSWATYFDAIPERLWLSESHDIAHRSPWDVASCSDYKVDINITTRGGGQWICVPTTETLIGGSNREWLNTIPWCKSSICWISLAALCFGFRLIWDIIVWSPCEREWYSSERRLWLNRNR